ncbi:MAG: hypothetical protein OXE03_02445 [Gammaproteobacteria bacterium]|nr:hypothetical protein [Gammaproteobacteria bacterium]
MVRPMSRFGTVSGACKNARSGIFTLALMLAPSLLLAPVAAITAEPDNAIWYKGWMAVKKHKVDPDADLSEWIFARIARMHNQGQKIPLTDEAGNNTGYTLSLESLTYEETQVPVLKIGVIEDRTGYTLAYSWADPGSRRVGLNVRWFQAGMTRIDEEHHE